MNVIEVKKSHECFQPKNNEKKFQRKCTKISTNN